ncbi:MAG: pyridoxal phosphate-dependent aminotransferase [Deltaproteobacteria bacterium]|nr:pyridoxal phosphate-dependent aminotransferase [Deltaproteobacteria bacterium]
MFSERTRWSREENALSLEARQARGFDDFIDLTQSNITRVGLSSSQLAERPLATLDEVSGCAYDPQPLGTLDARCAVGAYYERRGLHVPGERVMLTASTSEAYVHSFRLLADPGEAVLAPTPSYPLFSFLAEAAGISLCPYRLRFDGERWYVSMDDLRDRLESESGPKVRAILLVSPNNPTGSLLSSQERAEIYRLARAHEAAVVSDEVFLDFCHAFDDDRTSAFTEHSAVDAPVPLALTLSGLSKVAGLPQAKLAWMVASGVPARVHEAMARLEIMGDTFLSVSSSIQRAAPDILDQVEGWQSELRGRLRRNWAALSTQTATSVNIRARPISAGWHAVLALRTPLDDETWARRLLAEAHVLVHPGYLFEIEDMPSAVISLILPEETFSDAVARLVRHADKA